MQKLAIFRKVKAIKELRVPPPRREQVIPQIDPREIGTAFHGAGAEIAEKGNFWMKTIMRFPVYTESALPFFQLRRLCQ